MENKFQECVERKRIVPFSRGPKFVAKELKLANFDLSRANISFREKDYKQIYFK